MTPTERLFDALREHCIDAKPSGDGWACRCPAHDDRNPSLSISTGDDGRALVRCHAGCETQDIVSALGLTMRDLMPDGFDTSRRQKKERRSNGTTYDTVEAGIGAHERTLGPHTQRWVYHDGEGEPVCAIVRWDTHDGKTIRPVSRHADRSGWIARGLGGGSRPLYRLPELNDTNPGDRVYVCEGEKAADALASCGLVATTSMHGAKSPSKTDWTPLQGRDVVILPDHDEQGERYAMDVARLALDAGAKRVRIVRLQDHWLDLPAKGDAVDALELEGGDADAVRIAVERLAEGAEDERPVRRHGSSHLVMTRLSEVKPKPIDWLWPDRIATGKLSLLVGDPGVGKSFLTLDMAARVTTGRGWPDAPDSVRSPGSVVLLSAEDGLADTIRPRLDAVGADVERISAVSIVDELRDFGPVERQFDITRDLPLIERGIDELSDCSLVIIDPITAYLGETDSHKNAEVRGVLQGMSLLAEKYNLAVVAVSHLNKAHGSSAIYRTMGSLAFTAAARTVIGVGKDPSDPSRSVMTTVKTNIAPETQALAYRIESVGDEANSAAIRWEAGSFDMRAEDLFGTNATDDGGALGEAIAWLGDALVSGPMPASELKKKAESEGIKSRTLDRAKQKLGVESAREGFGVGGTWTWRLPTNDDKARQPDPDRQEVGAL